MVGQSQDAALVSLAVNGDGEAFACLYSRYKRNVWELSYYLCQRNHHDAEEAAQETFLKAWRSLRRYRASGTFKAWLLTICRHVCIDRVHRAPARPLALECCSGQEIADRTCDAGTVDAILLRATLAQLPRDECEAWFLVDVLGCSSDEASRIVGAHAASTVRSRVKRARLQIAAALCEEPEPEDDRARPTHVYGLYHSHLEKAIVVASVDRAAAPGTGSRFVRTRRASAGSTGECDGGWRRTPDTPAETTLARYGICDGVELVDFFDELAGDVPVGARIVVVVNRPATPATMRWCDARPRWELRAHTSWREEAERLLAGCVGGTARHGAPGMLALLEADEPFVWTVNPRKVTL